MERPIFSAHDAKVLVTGSLLATGWYATANALLPDSLLEIGPIMGAIAISGLVPVLFVKKNLGGKSRVSEMAMAERFANLKSSTLINVVDAENRLTEVNDEMLAFAGYSRAELIGKPVKMLYGPTGHHTAETIRSGLVEGKIWQGDTPLICADGSVRMTQTTVMPLFDGDGQWSGSISVRNDIAKNEAYLNGKINSTALHELRDSIWLVDAESEHFHYMNRTALDWMGLKGGSYETLTLEDIQTRMNITPLIDAYRTIRDQGREDVQCNIVLEGIQFEVSVKRVAIDDQNDQILFVFQDISNRVEKEQMKAEFVSTVSHELRSPLTSIKGSMGLLLSNAAGELPDKARGLLEIAHRNAERLVLIINDILDLEKIMAGGMDFESVPTDLSELINEAVLASSVNSRRFDVDIQTTGTDEPVHVHTDPNRVIQVLTNFLSNAAKFSRPNGKVVVSLVQQQGQVRVAVKDHGQGIPARDKHKIFERFADMANSDRAAKGGTGLGLSICKAIIENMGGDIGFKSQEGVGTTFYFHLSTDKANVAGVEASDPGLRNVS